MSTTLGDCIFKDIESNEYLQEIYDAILFNYSLNLFGIPKKNPIEFNLVDALRFADLLSKSTDPLKAELHKVWAQEIVALLNTLYPQNESVQFVMGSVLTNVCNYRGLSLQQNQYTPNNTFEKAYEEYKKSILKIPSQNEGYFFKSQRAVFDSLNKERFSYSGPTSMGKSFVMRIFIKEQIIKGIQSNFAIVVPTKALINEVSSRIITDLKELLSEKNYRVVTAGGAISLQQEHNFVLVLTPERLLYLLLERPNFKIDYLFIDEAHKISSKDSRSPFYYKIVDLLTQRKNKPHFVFSSPNIPNPDVYLNLTNASSTDISEKMTTSYSPVSQMKYIIDLVGKEVKIHNDYNKKFISVAKLKENVTLTQMIKTAGKSSQNIVYCSATSKAIEYALDYAKSLKTQEDNAELISLSREIKGQIHTDYYLADLLTKGVAYHIGYLPADIRLRIEDLFKSGAIKTIFCTSTLIEGVNLPADNLFITSYKNGLSHMTPVEFRNLVGRVGRIEFNLYGNVFLTRIEDNVETQKYVDLIEKEIPEQKLSLISELSKPQKKVIVECLSKGKIELLKHPANQSVETYELMRKFALILLKDIMSNRNSFVKKEFSSLLSTEIENQIRTAFSAKTTDEDINISSDQIENLTAAIAKGLSYPKLTYQASVDYPQLVSFLEKLCTIFKWEKYEKSTLGHISITSGQHGKLRWYAVILYQWISGNGLSLIMQSAIKYKQDHPASGVEIDRKIVKYDDSIKHRNLVISDTLDAIEDVVLFRIANYFLRFSSEYKRLHNIDVLPNDWYEYVEYGTTNALTIFLQRNGFSREAASYIRHHLEYIAEVGGEYKVKSAILECPSKSVSKEAKEVKYNIPELFI